MTVHSERMRSSALNAVCLRSINQSEASIECPLKRFFETDTAGLLKIGSLYKYIASVMGRWRFRPPKPSSTSSFTRPIYVVTIYLRTMLFNGIL